MSGQINRAKNLVLGAGPAGLSATFFLQKNNHNNTIVLEAESQVGGLSKTVKHNGYSFDIGGHRFFTKAPEVLAFWNEILGDEFLKVKRSSKIYYKNKFLDYPLRASQCFFKISPYEGVRFLTSFFLENSKKKLHNPKNYEEWMIKHFGSALYEAFFKSYTEKVWGMKCQDISATWAAQRINKLNLFETIKNSFGQKTSSKSLIDSFLYPEFGPGQFWERCSEIISNNGGEIHLENKVLKIEREGDSWLVTTEKGSYQSERIFYSLPLGLLPKLSPDLLSPNTSNEFKKLRYRHFVTVAVMGKEIKKVPTQWIYIQEEKLKVGRIQNYKYWSKSMVPNEEKLCVGMEFFCSDGDGLWEMSDEEWIALATKELDTLKIFGKSEEWVTEAKVVKAPYAYPIYDSEYERIMEKVIPEINKLPNFFPIGRNGMHRYNNQDHAIMTALLSVQNLATEEKNHKNPWNINQDAEYIEA